METWGKNVLKQTVQSGTYPERCWPAMAGEASAVAKSCVLLWMSVSTHCCFNWDRAERLWCTRCCGDGERRAPHYCFLSSLVGSDGGCGGSLSAMWGEQQRHSVGSEDITRSNAPWYSQTEGNPLEKLPQMTVLLYRLNDSRLDLWIDGSKSCSIQMCTRSNKSLVDRILSVFNKERKRKVNLSGRIWVLIVWLASNDPVVRCLQVGNVSPILGYSET